jgi:hypothetical protein
MRFSLVREEGKEVFYKRRMIEKFLFFPLQVGSEIRWLEDIILLQEYRDGRWVTITCLE